MNAVLVALVVLSGSVGVGLLGVVALRLLRPCPVGFSLLAVIGITVCALNTSTVTTVLIARSVEVPLAAHVTINLLAGAVSVLIGLLLVRVVLAGRGRRDVAVPDEPASSRLRARAAVSRHGLVGRVSRDPVYRIQDRIESIVDGSVDEPPSHCGQIRASTERLLGVVDDLLALYRIRAGDSGPEPREVALDDLVSDEVAELGALADENGIRLRAEVVEQVLVRVDGRMTRVLNELLSNGIRCSPAGAVVSVGVRASGGRPAGRRWCRWPTSAVESRSATSDRSSKRAPGWSSPGRSCGPTTAASRSATCPAAASSKSGCRCLRNPGLLPGGLRGDALDRESEFRLNPGAPRARVAGARMWWSRCAQRCGSGLPGRGRKHVRHQVERIGVRGWRHAVPRGSKWTDQATWGISRRGRSAPRDGVDVWRRLVVSAPRRSRAARCTAARGSGSEGERG